ncbi:DinB family protein [Paractinoplanes durhamensis]|uniref:Mini-circle protein n=1 Tax=Paractinoplanes durhamensis TaxID=113563 RepID=A0ABQ3Z594_9ACTN|nr:DinB family protein [Actinoplanes durhamensis]GIE04724.1 hypothetical protein Adu01nite_60740 [Actinoplanes durhamensis]
MADRRKRANLFPTDGAPDPRIEPLRQGDERATLVLFLRDQRLTLEVKCRGLGPEELAARSVEPSTMSLLGLVRHMADVERQWFRQRLSGEDVALRYQTAADPDGDFDFDSATTDPAEAWAAWREECAFTDRFISSADLGTVYDGIPGVGRISLRETVVHMIEEYARHNGHADLLRERIDGRIGQ